MSKQDDAAGEMLIREVEEDLRREYYARLWGRYGNWLIAAAILVVAIVAGYEGWQAWKNKKSTEDSTRYNAVDVLLREEKIPQAIDALGALRADSSTGYAALAGLQEAALLVREKKTDEARVLYDKVAADSSIPQSYREVAQLTSALLMLDTADSAGVEAKMRPFTAFDSPWRALALEITATALLKNNEKDRAVDLYRQVADEVGFPDEVRLRASYMLMALGVKPKE